MGYYLAIKKEQNLVFSKKWMHLDSNKLSEISQSLEDKCHVFSNL